MESEEIRQAVDENPAVSLYFSGENCSVCKTLKPALKKLMEEKFPKVKWLEISIDDFPQTAAAFDAFSIPLFLVYFDRKEFVRSGRFSSLPALEEEIGRIYSMMFD